MDKQVEKVGEMLFSKVYDLLVKKAERKGRTKSEVDQLILWQTGYTTTDLEEISKSSISYYELFEEAPKLNPNRMLIKGRVCGVRVEEIENSFMREVRILDKMVDELAKGKSIEKILK